MSPISARVGASMAYSCSGDGPDTLRVRELASDRELQSVSGGELIDKERLQGMRGRGLVCFIATPSTLSSEVLRRSSFFSSGTDVSLCLLSGSNKKDKT